MIIHTPPPPSHTKDECSVLLLPVSLSLGLWILHHKAGGDILHTGYLFSLLSWQAYQRTPLP